MKSFTAFFIIFWSIITFIPIIFLLGDMMINGRNSILNELIDSIQS
jgi:hypothetical protein